MENQKVQELSEILKASAALARDAALALVDAKRAFRDARQAYRAAEGDRRRAEFDLIHSISGEEDEQASCALMSDPGVLE